MTTITLPPEQQPAALPAVLWHFLRPQFLQLFRALAEVALILPLALVVMPWARLWPLGAFTLWLLMMMLAAYYLDQILSFLPLSTGRRRVLVVLAGVVAIVLNLRLLLYDPPSPFSLSWLNELYLHLTETGNPYGQRDFLITALTALAWWRGLALSSRRMDMKDTGRRFQIGLVVVLPLILLISGRGMRLTVTPFVLLFLFSSLMTLALTRAGQVEAGEAEAAFPVTPGWLGRVMAAGAAVVLLTAILTAMLSGDPVVLLVGWLAPLWSVVQALATVVGVMLFVMVQPLLRLLDWLIGLLNSLSAQDVTATPTPAPAVGTPQPTPTLEPPFVPADNAFTDFLAWLVANGQLLAVLGVLLLLAIIAFYAYRSNRQLEASGEVKKGAQRQGQSGQATPRLPGQGLLDRARRWRQMWNAASIRRIYENMLYLATVNGYPRGAVETPNEYIKTLDEAWPERHDEIVRITRAYIAVRYGEVPETRQELDDIRDAWNRLRQTDPVRRAPAESATEGGVT